MVMKAVEQGEEGAVVTMVAGRVADKIWRRSLRSPCPTDTEEPSRRVGTRSPRRHPGKHRWTLEPHKYCCKPWAVAVQPVAAATAILQLRRWTPL